MADTLDQKGFMDIFNLHSVEGTPEKPNEFSLSQTDNNIFKTSEVQETEEVVEKQEELEEKPQEENTDIFIHDEDQKKLGRRPKYNFTDTTGYFEDRITKGKFVPIEEEDDKGNKKSFSPKTPEEFDEFFDLQLNHRLSEKEKEVESQWYDSKSPAWKFIAQASEKTNHPSDLIPFLQGVQNIEDLSQVDETTPQGAEQVYRTWLTQRGEPSESIEDQIELAKSVEGKLTNLAGKYKPILIQQENQRMAELDKKNEEQKALYTRIVRENESKAREAIEAPIFGKQKLKDDEKALIYDLIALPSKESEGYAIYSAIDKLYQDKNFETLRKLALVLAKEESYLKYASNSTAATVSEGLQRTLKVANSKGGTSNNDVIEETKPTVNRTQYQQQNINAGFRRTG